MKINKTLEARKAPFTVVILDMLDRYYYADVVEGMEVYKRLADYGKAVALSDALFVQKNINSESLIAMNRLDDGYDVRVYNADMECIYASHQKYQHVWIGENALSPVLSSAMQDALRFAIETHEIHQKQKRKGKDVAYITHPLTVGLLLSRVGATEAVVIAGILHDTIEDSLPEKKVTKEMVAQLFGEDVAMLVESVTETNKSLSWEQRKKQALDHIHSFSADAVLLKSADVLANTAELISDYAQVGELVWNRFNTPKISFVANTEQVICALLDRYPESPLAKDLESVKEQLLAL